jgi:hypothetical protein
VIGQGGKLTYYDGETPVFAVCPEFAEKGLTWHGFAGGGLA